MRTAAVILAAGASTRFGSRKQDVRIRGQRMVDIIAATAADAGLAPVVAVLPPAFEAPAGVVAVTNGAPEAGISRSLQLGFEALPGDVEAAIVLLGDEPLVERGPLLDLIAAAETGARVVAARAGDRIGAPVLLRREAFDLVARTAGDEGLVRILGELSSLVTVDLRRPPTDVDTRSDLDALGESWQAGPGR
jgi:molybdenum cofactor cytidylyltransferase